MKDVLLDALLDSLKILPFLLIVYIIIEVIEAQTNNSFKHNKWLQSKAAPLIGAGVGLIPQCGFSVMATNLYARRSISLGTLIAVYIATSDEAIPILLSSYDKIGMIVPLLIIKLIMALVAGFGIDLLMRLPWRSHPLKRATASHKSKSHASEGGSGCANAAAEHGSTERIHSENKKTVLPSDANVPAAIANADSRNSGIIHAADGHTARTDSGNLDNTHAADGHTAHTDSGNLDITHAADGHTAHTDSGSLGNTHAADHHADSVDSGCCGHNLSKVQIYFLHPLIHSLKVFSYILILNIIMGIALFYLGEEKLQAIMLSSKAFQPFIAGLIGLIPNCASSVLITELYLLGGLNLGSAVAGLSVNAGIAFAILFKQNKPIKQNFVIVIGLYLFSCIVGTVIMLVI